MVDTKKSRKKSRSSEFTKNFRSKLNGLVTWSQGNKAVAIGSGIALLIVLVEMALIFGTSAQSLADEYKRAVNLGDPKALSNQTLFPTKNQLPLLPDFLASGYTVFTVSAVDVNVGEDGATAKLLVHTSEGATYELAASKKSQWYGPFYAVQWSVDSNAATIRVAPDPGLAPELTFGFADLPYSITEMKALASTGVSYATLPGVLRYTEPSFAFLKGGEQVRTFTSGATVLTFGPTETALDPELIRSSQNALKKSVSTCARKSNCKSLPKYKNKEFKVKTPAGSWDHLSTGDSYKLKNCTVVTMSYASALKANVEYSCPAKVTRHFVWSDTYQRGFFFWFWYISWTETAYKSDKKNLDLTVNGDIEIAFDTTKQKFTSNTLAFEGTKG